MSNRLRYAFMDESGTVGGSTGSHFLVIAVLSSERPRDIELPVRRAQKKLGKALSSSELKANKATDRVVLRLLHELSKTDIAIVAVIVDQSVIVYPPKDGEDVYRLAVSRAVRHLVSRWPRLEICLDRRYTSEYRRYRLEMCIRESLVDLTQQLVLIRQENSVTRRELQAADFIAWAFFQKYERSDDRFYNVIAPNVVEEEILVQKDWRPRQAKKNPPFGG